MRISIQKRLKQLESRLGINKRHKVARIICDPKIMHSFDFSEVDADVLLILPDNDRKIRRGIVPKDGYLVYWFQD